MTPSNLTECLQDIRHALEVLKAMIGPGVTMAQGEIVMKAEGALYRIRQAQPPLREAPANESRLTDGGKGLKVLRGEDPGVIAAVQSQAEGEPLTVPGPSATLEAFDEITNLCIGAQMVSDPGRLSRGYLRIASIIELLRGFAIASTPVPEVSPAPTWTNWRPLAAKEIIQAGDEAWIWSSDNREGGAWAPVSAAIGHEYKPYNGETGYHALIRRPTNPTHGGKGTQP